MQLVTSIVAMQRLSRSWKMTATKISFVPTMGCLHAGHLSLVRRGRQSVGTKGKVVVSIYVNPMQFAPTEDLAKYPRPFARDKSLCRDAGVDALFVPPDSQMYPARDSGGYSTYVIEESQSQGMEGAARPTHFRGVATIVAKLFNAVLPDVAVFGAKDFQQAAVVQRMTSDLNFPVKIVVAPTVRESDGLALSSRNQYLSSEERSQATVLWRSIQRAKEQILQAKRPVPAARLQSEIARLVAACPAARLDYVQFFETETLRPLSAVREGARIALAVFIGKTRLIDNASL